MSCNETFLIKMDLDEQSCIVQVSDSQQILDLYIVMQHFQLPVNILFSICNNIACVVLGNRPLSST